jgi:hypothetical protein
MTAYRKTFWPSKIKEFKKGQLHKNITICSSFGHVVASACVSIPQPRFREKSWNKHTEIWNTTIIWNIARNNAGNSLPHSTRL